MIFICKEGGGLLSPLAHSYLGTAVRSLWILGIPLHWWGASSIWGCCIAEPGYDRATGMEDLYLLSTWKSTINMIIYIIQFYCLIWPLESGYEWRVLIFLRIWARMTWDYWYFLKPGYEWRVAIDISSNLGTSDVWLLIYPLIWVWMTYVYRYLFQPGYEKRMAIDI